MKTPVYYVGTPADVEHHARPLFGEFDVRIEDAQRVLHYARPGDVCLFHNEFFPRYRTACHLLRERQCATLYALDGIFEWRSLWDFPPGISCLWSARPILSHKVACVGRSQARILGSWGHARQCEIVGVPRFDPLLYRTARVRGDQPFTLLVLTAKSPGFDQTQWQRVVQSLHDLKAWIETRDRLGGVPVQCIWRIAKGLEKEIDVENQLKDTTGEDLAQTLTRVDAVVTTPSTSMLEGMLHGLPVALLDYHNCPHYVPAAWRITAPQHLDQVLPELAAPSQAKTVYQRYLLHDALECASPALPRMCELIARMHDRAEHCLAAGHLLSFPQRLLPLAPDELPAQPERLEYARLFPENPEFAGRDVHRLQAIVEDLQTTLESALADKVQLTERVSERQEVVERLLAQKVTRRIVSEWVRFKTRREVRRLHDQVRNWWVRRLARNDATDAADQRGA